MQHSFGWLFAKSIVKFELCKLSFKMLNECGPVFYNNYLSMEYEMMSTRNKMYLEPVLKYKTAVGKKKFSIQGAEDVAQPS
jgi:hypothetical protein